MHKFIRIILFMIISCSMLGACTAASNKISTTGMEQPLRTKKVPYLIGSVSFEHNQKETGVFSSDGRFVATFLKNKIVVQRVRNGEKLFSINDSFKDIEALSFSSDSKYLAYTFYHKQRKLHFYQLVDVISGNIIFQSRAIRGMLSCPEVSADGKLIAFIRSTSTASTLYLKNPSSNKLVTALNLQLQKNPFLKFSSDSSKTIVVASNGILIIDAESGNLIRTWPNPFSKQYQVIQFALSHDSKKLIAISRNHDAGKHVLTSFDVTTGEHQSDQLLSHEYPFERLAVASDGTLFLAWDQCKKIDEYSVDNLQLQRTWSHEGNQSHFMHVGTQKILIGTNEYIRTPDAIFAAATKLLAAEQIDDAKLALQQMVLYYGEPSTYQSIVPPTLPCIESLLLRNKEESAQKAVALLKKYFPEALKHIRPSNKLLAAVESQFKKGQYDLASKRFAAIKKLYPEAKSLETKAPVEERNSYVVLGMSRATKEYKKLTVSIETYVKNKEKAYVMLTEYPIPKPIPKPVLPKAIKLTQNKFETNGAFAKRVEEAKKSREAYIQQLMNEYREKVTVYNSAVDHLEELKRKRIAELPVRRPKLIACALKNIIQGVHVEKPYFDRQRGLLSFDLVGNGAPYRTRIGTTIEDSHTAETLFKAYKRAEWRAEFAVSAEGFVLDNVECRIASTDLQFQKIDTSTHSEASAPASVLIASVTPDELGTLATVHQRQSTEIADYQSDITLIYNDGRAVKSTASVELDREIKQLQYAPIQSNNYLFAIGIESYKSAPNVPFAENSLNLISNLLRKKFGIPKENQIVLPSTEATGQAIQGHMRNIAARLTSNDKLFFYYAGHGLASRNGKDVYMLPSDAVRGAYEDAEFSFNNMIKKYFSAVGRAYVFLDTCFSGRADAQSMLTKGIAPVFKTSRYSLPPNVTVFFAGQGDQYANFYPQKGQRLFSYYVIRSVLDEKNDLKEMMHYLNKEVRSVSSKMGADHLQEPFIAGKKTGSLGQ